MAFQNVYYQFTPSPVAYEYLSHIIHASIESEFKTKTKFPYFKAEKQYCFNLHMRLDMTSCLLAIYASLMNLLFIFLAYLSKWGSSIIFLRIFFMICTCGKDINNFLFISSLVLCLLILFMVFFLNLYKFEIFC